MGDTAVDPHDGGTVEPAVLPDEVWATIRHRALSSFACDRHSVHGPDHWRRVEAVGLELCAETGGDETVVRLFAILHDSCRENDGNDPDHGPRAADLLAELGCQHLALDADRLVLLEQAIRHHTEGHVSDDPTIGTCWDADRLDLVRVDREPDAALLSTEAARRRVGVDPET